MKGSAMASNADAYHNALREVLNAIPNRQKLRAQTIPEDPKPIPLQLNDNQPSTPLPPIQKQRKKGIGEQQRRDWLQKALKWIEFAVKEHSHAKAD